MFFWVLVPCRLVSTYESTWHQNPEQHHHPHHHENLKSHIYIMKSKNEWCKIVSWPINELDKIINRESDCCMHIS
jgi:hypothetical protein